MRFLIGPVADDPSGRYLRGTAVGAQGRRMVGLVSATAVIPGEPIEGWVSLVDALAEGAGGPEASHAFWDDMSDISVRAEEDKAP